MAVLWDVATADRSLKKEASNHEGRHLKSNFQTNARGVDIRYFEPGGLIRSSIEVNGKRFTRAERHCIAFSSTKSAPKPLSI